MAENEKIICPSCGAEIDKEGKAVYKKSPRMEQIEGTLERLEKLEKEVKERDEQREKQLDEIRKEFKEKTGADATW